MAIYYTHVALKATGLLKLNTSIFLKLNIEKSRKLNLLCSLNPLCMNFYRVHKWLSVPCLHCDTKIWIMLNIDIFDIFYVI